MMHVHESSKITPRGVIFENIGQFFEDNYPFQDKFRPTRPKFIIFLPQNEELEVIFNLKWSNINPFGVNIWMDGYF